MYVVNQIPSSEDVCLIAQALDSVYASPECRERFKSVIEWLLNLPQTSCEVQLLHSGELFSLRDMRQTLVDRISRLEDKVATDASLYDDVKRAVIHVLADDKCLLEDLFSEDVSDVFVSKRKVQNGMSPEESS